MRHHVVYWNMARREVDVDDAELESLRERERRRDAYIEFVDGERQPLSWDPRTGLWFPAPGEGQEPRAA
jgi:hypothetical protein